MSDERKAGPARGRLTQRDRQLISALATARHLTTEQLARLFFPGRHPETARKRVLVLAGEGKAGLPQPYLRRLFYRTFDGQLVAVWTPTPLGYITAEGVLGASVTVPRADVSANFLEHSVTTNELLVEMLAAPLASQLERERAKSANAANPEAEYERRKQYVFAHARTWAFRWETGDSSRLPWEAYESADAPKRDRVIVPDAVLVFPSRGRRLFIECEMGTHTIAATSDKKHGATLAKLERYSDFISGYADAHARVTHYAKAFPDRLAPEVWFLVRTEIRKMSILAAIAKWAFGRAENLKVRVATFGDAKQELAAPPGQAVPAASNTAAKLMTPEEVVAFRDFYRATIAMMKERRARARARGLPPPEYPAGAEQVHEILRRLSA
ncbi:MAG: replication-relaxation family protein [Myxococcales bacterium]|nr:replication-relaxation family protein [Myxococcales bacterium]